jgi:hypothetical protein
MLASSGCEARDRKSFLHPILSKESGVAFPAGISHAFSVGSSETVGASELQAARTSATANVELTARKMRSDTLGRG